MAEEPRPLDDQPTVLPDGSSAVAPSAPPAQVVAGQPTSRRSGNTALIVAAGLVVVAAAVAIIVAMTLGGDDDVAVSTSDNAEDRAERVRDSGDTGVDDAKGNDAKGSDAKGSDGTGSDDTAQDDAKKTVVTLAPAAPNSPPVATETQQPESVAPPGGMVPGNVGGSEGPAVMVDNATQREGLNGRYAAVLWSDLLGNTDPFSAERQRAGFARNLGIDTAVVYGDWYRSLRGGTIAVVHPGPFSSVRAATQWCVDRNLHGTNGTSCFGVRLTDSVDYSERNSGGDSRLYAADL